METKRLRAFIEIVDVGSLNRAAANLRIAQPALSQQVIDLERQFGNKLLVRGPRGVTPTPEGLALYRHAHLILRQLDQAQLEVSHAAPGISGDVTLGIVTSAVPTLIVPLMQRAKSAYPSIRLRITEGMSGAISEKISRRQLDIGILSGAVQIPDIVSTALIMEQLFLITATSAASPIDGDSLDILDLRGIPLVLPRQEHNLRKLIDAQFAVHGLQPTVVAEVDSLVGLAAAASANFAATILPAVAVNMRRSAIRMQALNDLERPVSLCTAQDLPMLAATEKIHLLGKEVVEQLVLTGAWPHARLAPQE